MSRARTAVLAGVFSAAAAAVPAVAEVPYSEIPRGPVIGNVRYRSEITAGTVSDRDDFVTPLVAGEVITVTAAAEKGSALRPALQLLAPDGSDRTPELVPGRKGYSVTIRRFVVDATGDWAIRLTGAGATTGTYSLRCQVRSSLASSFRKQRVGAPDPVEIAHEFQAVEGANLSVALRLAKGSAAAGVTSLTDPSGGPVSLGLPRKKGSTTSWTGIVLGKGAGTYAATVGLDEGTARYDLSLRLTPPVRPKGTVVLSADEPRLGALGSPIVGNASQVIEIPGSHFATAPHPQVWFGSKKATVLTVSVSGTRISVVPPEHPDGAIVGVAVVNPDGQADARDDFFSYAVPAPARFQRISPATASVYTDSATVYTVSFSKAVGPGGATVTLSAEPGAGTVPATVAVPSGSASAQFTLTAAAVPGAGKVTATHDDVTVDASVTVVARPGGGGGGGGGEEPPPLPDEIDVGGWTIVQANSARTFTIPSGTKLKQGEYLVVGRSAAQQVFEAYWGVTLGTGVLYFDGGRLPTDTSDDWPSINGSETFELRDATGAVVDGPSAALATSAGENFQRIAGSDATARGSWTISTNLAPGGAATPGSGQAASAAKHGVYISEVSDASGSGNYVYEFVELHFDGLKP